MKKYKKTLCLIFAGLLMITASGCGKEAKENKSGEKNQTSSTEKSQFSKPNGDTASLMNPMAPSESDDAAKKIRQSVANAKDSLQVSGTKYYISMDGDDKNDGKSEKSAWATIDKLNEVTLVPGDGVFFRRGDVFRGCVIGSKGVSYGAFGSGDKPCIYGAKENSAMAKWEKTDKKNVYKCTTSFSTDVGVIVFNHGEAVGIKMMNGKDQMSKNFDFYYSGTDCEVYLYMDKGNPADLFNDIEVCTKRTMFGLADDVKIDNLCLKYGGSHCIQGADVSNVTVTNCEIGWIGGAIQQKATRFGNAIEFWASCNNVEINNNYIYQVYDTGITHQFTGEHDGTVIEQNIHYDSNLIEYCCSSIEYFLEQVNDENETYKNVLYENNVMRYAGFGFGTQRANKADAFHIAAFTGNNKSENFVIKNNIFDKCKYKMISVSAFDVSYLPKMSGNTYIQTRGAIFGFWKELDKRIMYTDDIKEKMNTLGIEQNATVYFREKAKQ